VVLISRFLKEDKMQSVRIETVETFVVAMPLVAVFSSGGKSKNVTKGVVVKVTASDGSYGISSVDPSTRAVFPDRAEDIAATVREKITPAVLGTSPTNINRLSDIMGSLQDIQIGARAAVEMAVIELTCRRLGISLCDFLGGAVSDHVAFNGWVGELPADEAALDAARWAKAGFQSLKIKVGGDVDADIQRVQAVRAAVGDAMNLRMDANEQYSVQDAIRLCDAIKDCDMQLFEQPVPRDDLTGLAKIRRVGGISVMADESISDHASLLKVIEADCADLVKFGIAQAGGIMPAVRMMATAEAAGLKVVMGHGFGLDMSTMAEIMVGASSSNILTGLECVGPLKVKDTVSQTHLDISSGSLKVPDGAGLAMDLDMEKLAEYTVQ